jgi:hypothetical protein
VWYKEGVFLNPISHEVFEDESHSAKKPVVTTLLFIGSFTQSRTDVKESIWILLLTYVATVSLLLDTNIDATRRDKRVLLSWLANQNAASPLRDQNRSEPASSPDASPTTSGQKIDARGASPPTPESKELFSQLTLFFFGSAIGFFIALLAWSDQIRGIDQDIRGLEARFLESTGIEKQTFLRIVKPKSADDRGEALLEVVSGGRIKNKTGAELLQIFTKWHKQWSWIEILAGSKYYVTIALTTLLFLMGFASLYTNPGMTFVVFSTPRAVERLILIPPGLLIGLLLIIIICIAEREHALRSLLKSVSDMV